MIKALLLAPMSSVHERFNVANIEALKSLGYEIHIASNFSFCGHDEEYKNSLDKQQIITHQIPFVRGSLLKNLKVIPQLKELLKNGKFDVVHCHTETGGILTRLSMSACKSAKYVFTPHGMSFYKGSSIKSQMIYYPIEKWICKMMSANLAMNSEELAVLQKWNENTAKFIHGIGVDIKSIDNISVNIEQKRREFGISADAELILSIGELNENKNHEVVIKAISQIENNENIYYMICGEGEKRDELMSLAKECGIAERFILTGYRYDVKEILKTADLFVFPSFHEGLAVSLMEAMRTPLPIVCSKIRGNVDLIQDGKGGYLCEPTDIKSITHLLDKLLNNEQLCNDFKRINFENAENYSIESVIEEISKIYSACVRE